MSLAFLQSGFGYHHREHKLILLEGGHGGPRFPQFFYILFNLLISEYKQIYLYAAKSYDLIPG